MTIAGLLEERRGDPGVALRFEDASWTYQQFVAGCRARAALLRSWLDPDRPPHIGLLLENTPEYACWLGAAALAGATVVGLNPTRRGPALARDARHADCQRVLTEPGGPDVEAAEIPTCDVTSAAVRTELAAVPADGVALPEVDPATRLLLLFTSGVSGEPKACICSQGRLAGIGSAIAGMFGLTRADVCYLAMPMFHSNALMAGFAPALAAGATLVLRRRFSASAFLPDVRRYRVTYFNYVGKPLSYILRTPARSDDADNTLSRVFGNEAAEADIEEFARRFGATVVDGYGSTEGGAAVARLPGLPPGAFGRSSEDLVVLDPQTGQECPAGTVGELVNPSGAGAFEGYWRDEEAAAARTRGGMYWTGDLAYRDTEGFLYFAGRSHEWLRVDGENLTVGPIERILARHPDVALAAVYAVPDEVVGDQVMAALELRPQRSFDPAGFAAFLAAQADLAAPAVPRFIRVGALPLTATSKVDKQVLRAERWAAPDPVWWRPGKAIHYVALPAERSVELSRRAASSSVATRRAQG